MRELSAAAGVSTGAFYSNFKNKRHLFDTIIDEIYAAMKSIMDETTAELISRVQTTPSGKLTSELVHATIKRIFHVAMNYTDLFDILRREGFGRDPDFRRQFNGVWESFVQATKRALDTYVRAGLSGPYDTELVARAAVPMSLSMLLYAKRAPAERMEEIFDTVAAILDGGILRLTSLKHEKTVSEQVYPANCGDNSGKQFNLKH
jgi:AcrR family transcriptional regulator